MESSLWSILTDGLTEDDQTQAALACAAMGEPEPWLREYFARYVSTIDGEPVPFAPHHLEFWAWIWALTRGERPVAFIGVWPRDGGKSTSVELALCAIAARRSRRYALYVSETQDQADDHVGNVAAMLESEAFGAEYPAQSARLFGKFGTSKGWRHNRLRTRSGFSLHALGLNTASRGVKLDEMRPDLIILDDIDNEQDTLEAVEKKIALITRKIVLSGSRDVAVLVIQNLVHPDSVVSQLTDDRAKFLRNRAVSGPIPAIEQLEHEERDGRTVLTGGTPTWAGQSLAQCQATVDDIGLQAFLAECQQEVSVLRTPIFSPTWWADGRNRYLHSAPLTYGEVAETWIMVDTAQKDEDQHDFSAFAAWQVLSTGRLRIRELRQEKLQFPDLLTATEDIAADYYPSGLLRGVIIEDKVSGTGAYQSLRASARYPWLRQLVGAWNPPGSKPYRARRASLWCSRDMIELPFPEASVAWLMAFERQLRDFPFVAHDDDVDVFTMGILYLENYLKLAWARMLAAQAGPEAA